MAERKQRKKGSRSTVCVRDSEDQARWASKKKRASASRFRYSTLKSGWLRLERHEGEEQIPEDYQNLEPLPSGSIIIVEEDEPGHDLADLQGSAHDHDIEPSPQVTSHQVKRKRKRKNRLVRRYYTPNHATNTILLG